MSPRRLLGVIVLAIPATAGCAECEADCAGAEVVLELDDPRVASVEMCQGTDCETRPVTTAGGAPLVFAVAPDNDDRVSVGVAARDVAGKVLLTDTFEGRQPNGECGCEHGALLLRFTSRGIEPT